MGAALTLGDAAPSGSRLRLAAAAIGGRRPFLHAARLRPSYGPVSRVSGMKAQETMTVPAGAVSISSLAAEAVILVPVSLHTRPPMALLPNGEGK